MTSLEERYERVRQALETATFATMLGETDAAVAALAEVTDAGLTKELVFYATGTIVGLATKLAERDGRDPAEVWSEHMRRPL